MKNIKLLAMLLGSLFFFLSCEKDPVVEPITIPNFQQWIAENCPNYCTLETGKNESGNDFIKIQFLLDIDDIYLLTFTGEDGLTQSHPGNGSCTRTFVNYNKLETVVSKFFVNDKLVAEEEFKYDY